MKNKFSRKMDGGPEEPWIAINNWLDWSEGITNQLVSNHCLVSQWRFYLLGNECWIMMVHEGGYQQWTITVVSSRVRFVCAWTMQQARHIYDKPAGCPRSIMIYCIWCILHGGYLSVPDLLQNHHLFAQLASGLNHEAMPAHSDHRGFDVFAQLVDSPAIHKDIWRYLVVN